MNAHLLAALLSAGSPAPSDPITEVLDPSDPERARELLQAVAQRRNSRISLADNPELADDLVLSKAARWVHIDYDELDRELASMEAVLARKDKPKLLLLVAEQNIGMASPSAWWSKASVGGCGDGELEVFEDGFVNLLEESGWQFVERGAVAKVAGPQTTCADLSDWEAVRLCKQSGGARVLVGRVATSSPGPSELGQGMVAASALVQVHLLDCQSGDTLKRINETLGDITTLDVTERQAGLKALRLAARHVARAVQTKIFEQLGPPPKG